MNDVQVEQVKELLRTVAYPGFSRDIVSAGFVGEISDASGTLEIAFKPNTRDADKISTMEQGMQDVLRQAGYTDVRIHRRHPFQQAVPLRSAQELAAEAAAPIPPAPAGPSRLMTPLQAEMMEDGELPETDLLGLALGRMGVAKAAGYGPEGPKPLPGPREPVDYSCPVELSQWSIDPHSPTADVQQHEIQLGEWDYRVWWQVHECGDLLYVSMQAMREDWVEHDDAAVPHPVGRSEAVNLVFDEQRNAIVAIYGTVRDFRPFVKAFWLAHSQNQGQNKAEDESTSVATNVDRR